MKTIKSRIILFALPIALCSIFQQLLNATDTAVLGSFSSNTEMAAVGDNASVINFIISMLVGLAVGANVVVAHMIGEKKDRSVGGAAFSILVFGFLCGVVMAAFCIGFAETILTLMGTPKSVLVYAVKYLKIYSLCLPALTVYFFGAAVLRGMGDSKSPTISVMISGVVNVILNYISVCFLNMGIVGVAVATDTANVLSALLILIIIKRKVSFEKTQPIFAENKNRITKTIKYGFPVGLQGMVFAVSNMIIQSAINSFGKDAIAGAAIVFNFECIGYYVIDSFNQSTLTFTSQNKVNRDICKKIYAFSLLFGVLGCFIVNGGFYLSKGFLTSLFTSDKSVIQYAVIRFTFVLLFQWVAGFYEISGATLRGMGHPFLPSVFTIVGTCVIRVIWVLFVFPLNRSFTFLLMIYPISWLLTSLLVTGSYYVIRKKEYN